ncbi:hypothetical protein PC118_g25739 [Phytophthora cactorum]|uniref:Uncharacterized protein n=1 Tax=Phytophthora cactorum TaxID=29920 RepID=A0A8T1E1U7_9STRA|nr:hypothetical protein PC112_g25668 [Phytophthora cactorum]KAG2945663.1 hypothetical protein PC118_g25739 [Phytophthora cactorum]KAG4033473.1 hypothetical protein PC123_g28806 [Phytophthora cactorum]
MLVRVLLLDTKWYSVCRGCWATCLVADVLNIADALSYA